MRLEWEGAAADDAAAAATANELADLLASADGPVLRVGNEFAEVEVRRVETRQGARVLVRAPRTGQWVALCPLELEALTWQSTATFTAMIGNPYGPLVPEDAPGGTEA